MGNIWEDGPPPAAVTIYANPGCDAEGLERIVFTPTDAEEPMHYPSETGLILDARSARVEATYRAKIIDGAGGKGVSTPWLYGPGAWNDLRKLYPAGEACAGELEGTWIVSEDLGDQGITFSAGNWAIRIEKWTEPAAALAVGYNWNPAPNKAPTWGSWPFPPEQSDAWLQIPPGQWNLIGGDNWNPAWLQAVKIPYAYTLRLRDIGGKEIELYGDQQGGKLVDLTRIDFQLQAVWASLLPDECDIIDIELDYSEATRTPLTSVLDTAEAENDFPAPPDPTLPTDDPEDPGEEEAAQEAAEIAKEVDLTEELEVSGETTDVEGWEYTVQQGWEQMESVTAKTEVEGTGIEGTEEFKTASSATCGTSGEHSTTSGHSDKAEVTVPPGQKAHLDLIVTEERLDNVKSVRTWQNLATGEKFQDYGTPRAATSVDVDGKVRPEGQTEPPYPPYVPPE